VEKTKAGGEFPERIGKKDGDLYKISFFFHLQNTRPSAILGTA
jgi:hypothetical protein